MCRAPVRLLNVQRLLLLLTISFVANAKQSFAQGEKAAPADCRIVIAPYVWTVNTNGDHTIGTITRPVDIRFSDIFSELQFAAAAQFEVYKNQWFGGIELAYLDFGSDSSQVLSLGNRFKSYTTEIWAGYGLSPLASRTRWEFLGGFRYTRQDLDFDITGNLPTVTFANDWFDPFVGLRFNYKIGAGQRWLMRLRGDLGGVVFGSALTAQLIGRIGYRVSRLFDLHFGAKYIYVDYKSGEQGTARFYQYKANQVGLLLIGEFWL